MGGNALKCGSQRMDAERYAVIKADILEKLTPFYERCVVPIEKPGKTSYGDLDVICCLTEKHPRGCQPKLHLNSKESVRNGHVLSFEYRGHQIDIINVNNMLELDFCRFFNSYGDMGMIVGMALKHVGLKLSDSSVSLHLPEYQQVLKLTNDVRVLFDFLGWNYDEYERRVFTTEEDVFRWICSMRFFRHSMFKRDEFHHEMRKRDADRPVFRAFVTYCNQRLDSREGEGKITAESCRDLILPHFDKRAEYEAIKVKWDKSRRLREKFNGKLVMKWTCERGNMLTGSKLGNFIVAFREKYDDDALESMEPDEIREAVVAAMSKPQY